MLSNTKCGRQDLLFAVVVVGLIGDEAVRVAGELQAGLGSVQPGVASQSARDGGAGLRLLAGDQAAEEGSCRQEATTWERESLV